MLHLLLLVRINILHRQTRITTIPQDDGCSFIKYNKSVLGVKSTTTYIYTSHRSIHTTNTTTAVGASSLFTTTLLPPSTSNPKLKLKSLTYLHTTLSWPRFRLSVCKPRSLARSLPKQHCLTLQPGQVPKPSHIGHYKRIGDPNNLTLLRIEIA